MPSEEEKCVLLFFCLFVCFCIKNTTYIIGFLSICIGSREDLNKIKISLWLWIPSSHIAKSYYCFGQVESNSLSSYQCQCWLIYQQTLTFSQVESLVLIAYFFAVFFFSLLYCVSVVTYYIVPVFKATSGLGQVKLKVANWHICDENKIEWEKWKKMK